MLGSTRVSHVGDSGQLQRVVAGGEGVDDTVRPCVGALESTGDGR